MGFEGSTIDSGAGGVLFSAIVNGGESSTNHPASSRDVRSCCHLATKSIAVVPRALGRRVALLSAWGKGATGAAIVCYLLSDLTHSFKLRLAL